LELSQIRYFANLATTLNFTEAARQSGVSQPSLTKAIRRLEEEFGGPLLYRDGKDTRLTALGRELQVEFDRIEGILAHVRELTERSAARKSIAIKVGVATTIPPCRFAEFWAQVLIELPMIELVFEPLQPKEGEADILSGKYDLCVLPETPAANFKLSVVALFHERLMIGMSEDHPLAQRSELLPEHLAPEPYLDRIHCEFRSQLVEFFKDNDIVMRPRIQSEREDWVQNMVAKGLGITALPEHSVMAQGIVLRPVAGLKLGREVSLVAVSGSGKPDEVQQILRCAREHNWSPELGEVLVAV